MTKRWIRRPEGSNWGDFGADDELGRLNLLTPEKVKQGVAAVPNEDAEHHPATAPMFIINPLTAGGFDNLFSTHPATANRIAALQRQAAEMGGGGFGGGAPPPRRGGFVGGSALNPWARGGNAPGGPSRWSTERSAEWVPLKPKLVVEVSYDHVSNNRFRHGTRLLRLVGGRVGRRHG